MNPSVVDYILHTYVETALGTVIPESPFIVILPIERILKAESKRKTNGIQRTILTRLDDLDCVDNLTLMSNIHRHYQQNRVARESTC